MATQLVPLMEVERLSATVIRILGGNPGQYTLQGTNTYLVGRGPQRLLVDSGEGLPCWPIALKSVLAAEKATVQKVLLTHWHHDHVRGVPDLLKICPNAKVYKNDPSPGQLNIEDGQVFEVEGATLRAFHTPGHAYDHMCFMFDEENAIFTGDNVLGHGTAVFDDLAAYVKTLKLMAARISGIGYPGHGAIVQDCKSRIVEYLGHRQRREDEILQLLRTGLPELADYHDTEIQDQAVEQVTHSPASNPRSGPEVGYTPIELVKHMYSETPVGLHWAAARGVGQVLAKLEGDGKVVSDGGSGKWRLTTTGRSSL
ncbi:hypothetical protein FQN57_001447 [Myotisia sp. PD_48]|nr:hypothetical protein FQN57_001447 [Myotisia sp. PD_48]